MADVKISNLPASTVPLAGTEVLPIVQGTTTKQVAVSDLTAGRAISVTNLTATGSGYFATSIGVGNTSPIYLVDYRTTSANAYATTAITNNSSAGYTQQLFNVGDANGTNGQAQIGYAPGIFFAIGPTANDTTTPIIFRNNNGTERMRLFPSGGVSIGNTIDKGAASVNVSGLIFPQQATTAAAPAYVKGAIYFDTTLNKLRVGGATAWETITSV
jgi:hypothetical protein